MAQWFYCLMVLLFNCLMVDIMMQDLKSGELKI
jgi:hypothetical protein